MGDTIRMLGPFIEKESLWWNVDGRNKKSITLALCDTSRLRRLDPVRGRTGNVRDDAAPGNKVEPQDGRFLTLTISGDTLFVRLCTALGRPELATDPRFLTHQSRVQHIDILNPLVADWIVTHPVDEISAALEKQGIPFSIAMTIEDIFEHPQYAARENIVSVDHPTIGPFKMQGIVPKLSKTPPSPIVAAPLLGANNDEVYRDLLGLGSEALAQLREEGVI